ncbi:MAG TPA: hypothetical protein VFF19_34750, partial [Reyranella sp.]|nr:hypothetical protein [Reyranella sp.]
MKAPQAMRHGSQDSQKDGRDKRRAARRLSRPTGQSMRAALVHLARPMRDKGLRGSASRHACRPLDSAAQRSCTSAQVPAPSETLASEGFATVAGGKGANQAVA